VTGAVTVAAAAAFLWPSWCEFSFGHVTIMTLPFGASPCFPLTLI